MQSIERDLALLGDKDPIQVLQFTPLRLEELLETLSPADLEASYAPGKWSPRKVLAHLADVELLYGHRLRLTLAQDEPVLQPFEPDRWAERYERADAALAVATFRSVRSWNLSLLTTLDLDDWLKQGYHAERGMESMDLMVRTLAGHDLNHLVQLERVASGG